MTNTEDQKPISNYPLVSFLYSRRAWILFLSILGLIIGIIGIVQSTFSLKTTTEEIEQATDLIKSSTKSLYSIDTTLQKTSETISTRSIGPFPKNIPALAEFISKTKERIIIQTDIPAYGIFSNTTAFSSYQTSLQSLVAESKNVRLIVYGNSGRKSLFANQLDLGKDDWDSTDKFNKFLNSGSNKQKLRKYVETYDLDKSTITTFTDLYYSLDTRNQAFLGVLKEFGHTRIDTVDYNKNPFPIHFWLRDDDACVFSFLLQSEEVSIQTEDPNIHDYIVKYVAEKHPSASPGL